MNLNSKYFDRIRIRPDTAPRKAARRRRASGTGAPMPGGYRAPKGRLGRPVFQLLPRSRARIQQVLQLLRRHARRRYHRLSALRGDRPSADLGDGRQRRVAHRRDRQDPGMGRRLRRSLRPLRRPARGLAAKRPPRSAGPSGTSSGGPLPRSISTAARLATAIKARYKELVKRLHPDANGGDRSSEDRLREIIQAYHYLKSAGFC